MEYVNMTTNGPKTIQEAVKSGESARWESAICEEIENLEAHGTWTLIEPHEVKPDHIPSQRVLEKAGLRLSGTCEAYGEPMLPYEAHRELWRAGA